MKMRRGQFDLSYLIYLSIALVLLLLIRLLTPPPPPPVNIKGTWEGEWNLSAGIGPFSVSASLRTMNGSLGVDMTSAVGIGILSIAGPSLSVNGSWEASKE